MVLAHKLLDPSDVHSAITNLPRAFAVDVGERTPWRLTAHKSEGFAPEPIKRDHPLPGAITERNS